MPPVGKEEKKGRWSADLVLDLYSNLLTEIWEIVSALIGEAILALLFNLAVHRSSLLTTFNGGSFPHSS